MSTTYAASLAEFKADKAVAKADKFALRAAAKVAAARKETALFKGFTDLERSEYLKECFGRYKSFFLDDTNLAATFGLGAEDFGSALFERQQVAFLEKRRALLAPLEELFED